MRDLRDDALALAAMGWHVFPIHSPDGDQCDCRRADCPSPSKHPRTRNGFKDASTALDQVLAWWEMWPHANIGIATGEVSMLVVIDIDPRHGGDETLNKLIEEHGQFPYLPFCTTGGGGQHYYFRHPGGVVQSRANVLPGIDVRGDGGYVVAPPSVHQTGVSYCWEPRYEPGERCQPPEMPAWLLEVVRGGGEAANGPYPAAEVPEDVPPGERNSTLASLGGTLRRRGLSERAIFGALMAINAEWSQPLDRAEVARIAASVARYQPEIEIQVINDAGGTKRSGPDISTITPYRATLLRDLELPELRWAVPELLPEGLALAVGASKFGKSWWALNIAVAVAEGGIALGEVPVDEGDVLYIALEDTRLRMKSRMAMVMRDELYPDRLQVIDMGHKFPKADMGGLAFIDAWLGQHPEARLVVIDTLQRFRGSGSGRRNASAYAEDYAEMEPLQEMAGRHCVCILFLHHVNKTLHEDWVDKVSGTTGLAGAADTLIGLMRPRGRQGQQEAVMRITGRSVEEQDYAITFDGKLGRWSVLGDAGDVRVQGETKKLLDFMTRVGHPVNKEEVAAGLEKTKPAAYKLLYRTALDGFIVSRGDKFYELAGDAEERGHAPSLSSMSFLSDPPNSVDASNQTRTERTRRTSDIADKISDVSFKKPLSVAETAPDGGDISHTRYTDMSADIARTSGWEMSEAHQAEPPADPCAICGNHAWTLRMGNRWMCDQCQPYISEGTKI